MLVHLRQKRISDGWDGVKLTRPATLLEVSTKFRFCDSSRLNAYFVVAVTSTLARTQAGPTCVLNVIIIIGQCFGPSHWHEGPKSFVYQLELTYVDPSFEIGVVPLFELGGINDSSAMRFHRSLIDYLSGHAQRYCSVGAKSYL